MTTGRFGAATAVTPVGDGTYSAAVLPGWDIAGNANGGYLLAVAARALINATAAYIEMIQDNALSPGMTARIEKMSSGRQPGHYPVGKAPVGLWEGVEPTVLGGS